MALYTTMSLTSLKRLSGIGGIKDIDYPGSA